MQCYVPGKTVGASVMWRCSSVRAYQKYRWCHGNMVVVKNGSAINTEACIRKGKDIML